jgi:mitochondrial fission protein ELM1
MNREDIIRLAQEAGAAEPNSLYGRTDYVVMTHHELERFAIFVAAAERKECAKVCDEYAKNSSNPMNFAENCAAAIRARSE